MASVSCLSFWWLECRYCHGGDPSVMQISGVADRGIWLVGRLAAKKHVAVLLAGVVWKPTWMRFSDWHLESGVWLVCQTGVNETAGGRDECSRFSPSSTPPSPPSILHHTVPFTMAAPAHQSGEGGLAKVVNGQPEHVIGAHPCIVNVLQDETLMETHDGVIICLQTHTHTNRNSRGFRTKSSSIVINLSVIHIKVSTLRCGENHSAFWVKWGKIMAISSPRSWRLQAQNWKPTTDRMGF